eukprot:TRINITY_DN10393_c0_g1_i1.p1 TRINITY_DN10393_c0_g1~~TRINITY_DN10393_c0_g1_i1.p1  ORF type:complete len:545 (-),score=128.72 TRINITY_DN10393_c0_g1_i1:65-1666(-)
MRLYNRKLGMLLPSHNQHLEVLHENADAIVKDFEELVPPDRFKTRRLCLNFQKFVSLNRKLLSYNVLGLLDEQQQTSSSTTIKELNTKMIKSNNQIQRVLEKLQTYVFLVFRVSMKDRESCKVDHANSLFIFQQIECSIFQLKSLFKELATQIAAKFLEQKHHFIIASIRSNNDQIQRTFTSIVNFLGKVASSFQSLRESLFASEGDSGDDVKVIMQSPSVGHLQLRARNFLKIVNNWPLGETLPYEEALENRAKVKELSNTNLQNNQRIESLEEKTALLEKEKKKLQSELTGFKDSLASKQAQLNTLLLELTETRKKITKGVEEGTLSKLCFAEEGVPENVNGRITLPTPAIEPPQEQAAQKRYTLSIIDESGNETNGFNLSEEEKERETQLKKFYDSKLYQTRIQLTVADSKALELQDEAIELEKKLEESISNNQHLTSRVDSIQIELSNAKDDLDLTRTNYESQLKVLTEHVLSHNDQIHQMKDRLAILKSHRVYCGRCHTWNTVEWLISEGRNGQRCKGGNHPSGYNYT